MKIQINKYGDMRITPETWEDDEKLYKWYKANGKTKCNKVIVFERKNK